VYIILWYIYITYISDIDSVTVSQSDIEVERDYVTLFYIIFNSKERERERDFEIKKKNNY